MTGNIKAMKKYVPIDMPQDFGFVIASFEPETRAQMKGFINRAYAQGKWRATEDILFDVKNPEFLAYYVQKAIDPLREPMKGSGLKEKLAPYRQTQFDLTPKDFVADKSYRLSTVGDLMRGKHLEESKDRFYDKVSDLIFGADCIFGNLESSIGEPEDLVAGLKSGEHKLNITRGEYETLSQYKGRAFDVLQLANNHVLDCGEAGIAENISAFKQDQIAYVGVYETEAASQQVTCTQHGDLKIAWVSHTFSVNNKPLPDNKPWMVDITPFDVVENPDTSRIEQQIQSAKAAGCDLVLLALHWGAEWEFYPQPQQLDWAHRFAELGVDAIIGTHPHVIQPVEIYRPQSDPDKAVPIIYNLGNLTPIGAPAYNVLSLVANLTITKGQFKGAPRTMVTGLEITPVVYMGEEEDGQIYAAIVPLAELNNSPLDPGTRDYVTKINGYADLVIGEDWRREDSTAVHNAWLASKTEHLSGSAR